MRDPERVEHPVGEPEASATPAPAEAAPPTGGADRSAAGEPAEAAARDAEEGLRRGAPEPAADPREQELARLNDRLLRVVAEFDNYKKRVARDQAELVRTANEELLLELLPVLDNLERALVAGRRTARTEGVVEGVDLVLRLFQAVLERAGVKPIDSVGQPFDPHVHQAVEVVSSPDGADQTVVEEVQRGYWLHTKVLRPAMVKVARTVGPTGPHEDRNP